MKHFRLLMLTLVVLVAVVVAACSSSADAPKDRASTPAATLAGGPGVAAGTTGGTGPSIGSGFGNAATPLVQPNAPVAGSGQPQPMAATPTVVSNDPISIDSCVPTNQAGLSTADTQKLMAGGAPGKLRFLYPYEGTVFPRGILPPTLMWDGATGAQFVYLHMKAERFEYKGCLKPTADGQLTLPMDVWTKAGEKTKGSADPFKIELSVMGAGAALGPITSTWTIAQATIKGSIYYNSYSSMLGSNSSAGTAATTTLLGFGAGGMVLRIPPGGKAEAFVSSDCNGCHSVSANGARLLSMTLDVAGQSFKLDQNTSTNPSGMMAGPRGAYGALYPDGSVYLATSLVVDVARSSFLSLGAATDAMLYRTDDGMVVPNTGIPAGALMPMFSPDGSLLVFNDFAINQAHGLAVMNYNPKTHAATGYRMLFTDTALRPGWPFVLPDNGGVIFTRTDGADFSGDGAGISLGGPASFAATGPVSDVHFVDMKTSTVTILAKAMGFNTPDDAKADKTYLPFGAEDLHKSYFPTLSPVAAGGYFWMFFDAVRHYGNLGVQRQLWGAAIDIAPDGSYSVDRSHPAFYLPGQEFGTGNHRAFAALDPCKKDSDSCTSGTDCCGGFCYVAEPSGEFVEAKGSCASHPPPMVMCSKTNERCTVSSDCCPPTDGQPANTCIAGFCAMVQQPQ